MISPGAGKTADTASSQDAAMLQPAGFLRRWRSHLTQAPLVVLSTAVMGSISLVASLFDRHGVVQHRIARLWAKSLLAISASPVEVIGAENLLGSGAAVYAVNHLSYMDTPVVFAKLPFQFRILANEYLFRIPFLGWHLARSGQLPVDTTNAGASIRSLSSAVKTLREGMPVVVFPEGGRSADGSLQPFLQGPAYMAIRSQVPVVPVALVGTRELLPMHVYHLRPRPLKLIIGKPINSSDYTIRSMQQLTSRVFDTIHELYVEHSD